VKERRERDDEPERTPPAIPARRLAGLSEHLLRLQASAGNAAVSRALARTEDEDEASHAERVALYYTALRPSRPSAEPIEEIGDFFDEIEEPPAAAEENHMALYYSALTPPKEPAPEPFENLRGFFPSEKQKPEPLEGLEGTKLFNEPKPPKQKAKAPPAAYNPLGFLGQHTRAVPVQVVQQPAAKPAAKPAKAKPAKRAPRPFESELTEEQQSAVETESQRMMTAIARRLEGGDSGNRTIDIGVPAEAVADVKNWLRTRYDDVVAPTRGPRNEEVRYHIVTDRNQRTKIDITGHIWIRGEDRTQGGGRPNVFNYHVEWAQHW
jgi:hypothetical protein